MQGNPRVSSSLGMCIQIQMEILSYAFCCFFAILMRSGRNLNNSVYQRFNFTVHAWDRSTPGNASDYFNVAFTPTETGWVNFTAHFSGFVTNLTSPPYPSDFVNGDIRVCHHSPLILQWFSHALPSPLTLFSCFDAIANNGIVDGTACFSFSIHFQT
jgi:hypothetical protein